MSPHHVTSSRAKAALLGLALMPVTTSAQARVHYLDPAQPVERRVDDLLGRMTLEEKVGQMLCLWQGKRAITDRDGRFDPARAPKWFRIGVGRIERPGEGHGARAEAEFTNAIQRWVKDSTRLGIPVLFHEEALHGLEAEQATSFPQAIALASTWNPELVERVFAAAAAEARARGVHQVLAPVVDVARDPRWGRIEETYGEDPYLAARMGVAAVRGFQGTEARFGTSHMLATLKHMTGHGQPESGTSVGPAPYGERTMRDVFLYPFEVAIREAGARSVMPSYNEVDGVPSHANQWLLHDVLRGEWRFDGVIVSDWFAISQLADLHHVAADHAEAARRALAAGVDVELPDVQAYGTLVDQVRQGRVAEATIDTTVQRLLRAKFELGLFENPVVDPDAADRISGADALAGRGQVAIVVVGDNEMTSREAYAPNHLGDRADLGLPGEQEELVRAVLATGTRTVLVLIHGRPLSIPALVARGPAILDGWYLGHETGPAVAEALFGDIDPGGKLPVTVARHVGQLPVFYNYKPSGRRGYLFDTTRPLFPFGYGLSYTRFAYANLRVMPARIGTHEPTAVPVDVTNTGTRAGDEVAQLYIRDAVSLATRPVKELRGFRRVPLQPGETRTVTFEIGPEQLAYHGPDMKRVVEPGQFEVMVGGNSVDVQSAVLDVIEER